METHDVCFDDMYLVALNNLRQFNTGDFEEAFPGGWISSWEDGLDPSRILFGTDTTDQLEIKGDPVLFAPHREILLVVGSFDTVALRQAKSFCEPYCGLKHSLLSQPVTFEERSDGMLELRYFQFDE